MVWSRVMLRAIYWRRLATAPPNSTGPVIGLRPRFRLEGSDWDGLWCNAWRSLRVPHWATEQKCIGNSHSKTFLGATVLTQYVANWIGQIQHLLLELAHQPALIWELQTVKAEYAPREWFKSKVLADFVEVSSGICRGTHWPCMLWLSRLRNAGNTCTHAEGARLGQRFAHEMARSGFSRHTTAWAGLICLDHRGVKSSINGEIMECHMLNILVGSGRSMIPENQLASQTSRALHAQLN